MDSDAILVPTEWPEFAELDWKSIERCAASGVVVLDARNILDHVAVNRCQLVCLANGAATGY